MTNLQQLLALHYAYPLTVNQLQRLLHIIKTLDELKFISASKLAQIIGIQEQTARTVKAVYMAVHQIDLMEQYEAAGIEVIVHTSNLYPEKLLQLFNPPAVLYVKGDSQLLMAQKKIACIGSREATSYSAEAFKRIIPPLVENQCVIVSGLAKGADTLAHRATIHYGGKTIAVLGHGFQTIYPKKMRVLHNI